VKIIFLDMARNLVGEQRATFQKYCFPKSGYIMEAVLLSRAPIYVYQHKIRHIPEDRCLQDEILLS
jgi:hypothetical protein